MLICLVNSWIQNLWTKIIFGHDKRTKIQKENKQKTNITHSIQESVVKKKEICFYINEKGEKKH